jgi:hypothetical protein
VTLLTFADADLAAAAEELCVRQLLLLGRLCTLPLLVFIDLGGRLLGRGEQIHILDEHAHGLALEVGPGDGEGEIAQVALLDIDRQAELVERRRL